MKKALLYLILLLLPFGCQRHYQYPLVIQEADSLCVAQPDSAVALLKSISDDMQQAPEYVQMRYKLLTIKANDKAYINHTSDSLILSLVDYYEHGGDPTYLGEAYYYAGSTYRDLGDAPRALEYYQKALDAMPGDENLKVKSKVYAQMGQLFILQKLYREAYLSYKNAYQSNIIQKDTVSMIYNLRDMGFAYRGLDKPDSTLFLLNQAHELALIINNEQMDNRITSQMASLYIRLDDLQKAKEYIQPSLKRLNRNNLSSVLSIAGDIYYKLGQYDSATICYQTLINNGTIYAKRDSYYNLANIAQMIWKDSKKGLYYTNQYKHLQDSINGITATESIAQANALYNYQIREKENHELEIKNNRAHVFLLLLTILALVVIIICTFLVLLYKNRRIRAELYIERLKYVQDKVYRESADMLAENNRKIASLEQELEQMRLSGTTDIQKEAIIGILESENENLGMKLHLREDANLRMQTSQLRKSLRERAKVLEEIREEEWKGIESYVNIIYPDFLNRLQAIARLNKSEYRTCLLLKYQLSPSEIAALLNLTSGGVANIRRRLSQRILLQSKNPSDWDQFIHSL
ncbi:MAG: tetratricopeptide repeat protein [Bacteroidaceae bacterium]|nr:tetratricopeptide repeat protein [Bacteroidaceae bacterium]